MFVVRKNPLMYMVTPRPVTGPRLPVRYLWPMLGGGPYHYKSGMGDTEYTATQLNSMSGIPAMNNIFYSVPTAAGVRKMQAELLNINAGQGNQVFTVQPDGSMRATGLTTGGMSIGMVNHLHAIVNDYIQRFISRASGKPTPTPKSYPAVSKTVLNTSALQLLSDAQIAAYGARIAAAVQTPTTPPVTTPVTVNVVTPTVQPPNVVTTPVTVPVPVVTPPAVQSEVDPQVLQWARQIQALAAEAHKLNPAYRDPIIDVANSDLSQYINYVDFSSEGPISNTINRLSAVIIAARAAAIPEAIPATPPAVQVPAAETGATNTVTTPPADGATTNVVTPAGTTPEAAAVTVPETGWKKYIPWLLGGGLGLFLLMGNE